MRPGFVHIVWSPATGPIRAYWSASDMHRDALTMVGAEVITIPVLDRLPDAVLDLIESDFDGDDETPPVEIVITLDDVD